MARITACGLSVRLKPGLASTGGATGVNGLPQAESGVVLALAAIQTAKALGRNKVEIVDGLGVLCDLCRVETGIQVS